MSADADRIGVATANLWADITREIQDFSPRPVGFGGYSDIYTAVWRSGYGDMKVAVKVIRAAPMPSNTGELPRVLRREISVWKRLLHPNIHVLCGFYEGFGSAPALVSPWYDNGDINEYTRRRADDPDIGLLKLKLFADIATGLRFLHENHIVHGDIKGGNVLISDDGVARLCDFGLSRLLLEHSQSLSSTGGMGTWRWMAPELHLVEGARHSYATDIWACGCLFIEVWSNVMPYHTKHNERQVMLALWQREPPARPSQMPDMIWTIVQACCNFDVPSRPSASQVCVHISLHLTMQRLHPMVMCGRPIDRVGTQILRDIDTSLQIADSQHVSGLYVLSDTEVVTEILRLLAICTLSLARGSSLFKDPVFQWCLVKFGTGSLLLPARVSLPDADDDGTFSELAGYEPDELIPLARLVDRARPGLANDLMTMFATPALGRPFNVDTRVWTVAWFSYGNRIVVGCGDATLRILDVGTGATRLRLVGHTEVVNHVAVSPNGNPVASCSDDGSIRLWDAETGHAIGVPMVSHTECVLSVAFSPDGRRIVSGSDGNTIRVWSTDKCITVLGPLRGHTATVYSVAYSPHGLRIVSGSLDSTVRVWDARTGDPIIILCGHTSGVRSVAYSPDGLRIVSGSHDHAILIWDESTGELVRSSLEGHSDGVRSVAYSPAGTRIVSGSHDRTIRIWDTSSSASIATIRGHTSSVLSVAFSLDGKRLASASRDGTVRIWDATDNWRRWDI